MVTCPNCGKQHEGKDNNYYCPKCSAFFRKIGAKPHIDNTGKLSNPELLSRR